jgi:hypothetical protein
VYGYMVQANPEPCKSNSIRACMTSGDICVTHCIVSISNSLSSVILLTVDTLSVGWLAP